MRSVLVCVGGSVAPYFVSAGCFSDEASKISESENCAPFMSRITTQSLTFPTTAATYSDDRPTCGPCVRECGLEFENSNWVAENSDYMAEIPELAARISDCKQSVWRAKLAIISANGFCETAGAAAASRALG